MDTVLFVHNNMPAQFGFLAEALTARGTRVAGIAGPSGRATEGMMLCQWRPHRAPAPDVYKPAFRSEADIIRGRAAADCALRFKQIGFRPDVIVGHPGMGSTLFLRDVFPDTPQIVHGEFYYHVDGGDAAFDPEFGAPTFEDRVRIQALNAPVALAYAQADRIVCPTPYQKSLLPPAFQALAEVVHEGVDTDLSAPRPGARLRLADGCVLDGSRPVITLINRRFEPLRGFHVFMRALPKLLQEVPDAEVVLIGSDDPDVYGFRAPEGRNWKQVLLQELEGRLDLDRLHFVGLLPQAEMVQVLSVSTAHVYFTYPFVLSWSILDAMACGCLVVGSNTPPVRDVIEDGVNGLMVDFFDVEGLARALIDACRTPARFAPLRQAARRTVLERFDRRRVCLPQWLELIDRVRTGGPC